MLRVAEAGWERTVNCSYSGIQHRSDEDVTSDQPLSVHAEKLRFVRELVEQGPDGWKTISGSVGEESIL